MLRVRKADGKTVDVPKSVAIEYTTDDGKLACVVTQERGGRVRIMVPGDKLFTAYCNSNHMNPADVQVFVPDTPS